MQESRGGDLRGASTWKNLMSAEFVSFELLLRKVSGAFWVSFVDLFAILLGLPQNAPFSSE